MQAIRVEGLTKRYGALTAVDNLSFTVGRGETLGLLGGNGAGKTTTMSMLLGLLIPTAGSIAVLGRDMARDRFAALARMNFSSPYIALPGRLTVLENLRVYGHLYGVRQLGHRIAELAEQLELAPFLHRAAGQLSAGLIEKEYLRSADPSRGRFRAFLLAACKHFLANERDRGAARKRGGGRRLVSIDRRDARGATSPSRPTT